MKAATIVKELRVEFLTGSVFPVLLGTAIAHYRYGVFDGTAFVLTLAGVALIHLGANVSNDYFDHLSGNDEANRNFVRPFTGGSRLIQEGALTPRQVAAIAIVLIAAAVACGLALASTRGPGVLALGAIGVASGVFYVAPPVRLAARGLGELFIGLNFGVLATMGACWVQTGAMSLESFVASLPLAVLIAAVVYINEFQDSEADAAAGKRTLVVRMGLERASRAFTWLMLSTYVPVIAGAATGLMPPHTLIALATAPLALRAAAVARRRYASPRELAPANAFTIMTHAATGVLLVAGYLLAR